MIISHKFKFIFIKTRKTASTSIEVFLSKLCGNGDIFTPIYPEIEGHEARNYGDYYNHIGAAKIRNIIDYNIWKTYFKFCVERNPWDKTLSYYYMLRARSGNVLSFEDYLSSQDFCNDYEAYTDPDNSMKIIVDQVIRYEDLSQGLSEVFSKLSIPFNGELSVRAKSEYRTNRTCYTEIYSESQAKIVQDKFITEINLFGYKYS